MFEYRIHLLNCAFCLPVKGNQSPAPSHFLKELSMWLGIFKTITDITGLNQFWSEDCWNVLNSLHLQRVASMPRSHSLFFPCILQPLELEAGTRRIVAQHCEMLQGCVDCLLRDFAFYCILFLHFFAFDFRGSIPRLCPGWRETPAPKILTTWFRQDHRSIAKAFFWFGYGWSNAWMWYSCQICFVDISSHDEWRDKTKDSILEGRQAFPGFIRPGCFTLAFLRVCN